MLPPSCLPAFFNPIGSLSAYHVPADLRVIVALHVLVRSAARSQSGGAHRDGQPVLPPISSPWHRSTITATTHSPFPNVTRHEFESSSNAASRTASGVSPTW